MIRFSRLPSRWLSFCFAAGALASALTATAAPGDLDSLELNVNGAYVTATAVQPDGKIIVAGKFSSVLGVARNNIARINTDGTLDTGFDPKANDEIYSVVVQPDGKILVGGRFTALQPNGAPGSTARQYVARLSADGTLDTDFDPKANNVLYGLALQPDGKVLLAGEFTTLQPNGNGSSSPRQYIARVNADGTLDPVFDPKANTNVRSVAVQPDGKILLVGAFTTLQPNGAPSPTSRQNIARVNADGSLDPGFDPKANNAVYSLAVQSDGKILLGGLFTSLQPNGAPAATVRSRMARVNTDGSLDTAFDPSPDDAVLSIAIQTDGKIVVGGGFYVFQSTLRRGIARLNTDGTVDSGFDPKTNNTVLTVALQADGKVLLGGTFTTLQPNGAPATTVRNYFARLQNDAAIQTLTVYDPTHIVWQRSGAAPEVSRATFDLSTDSGATWNPLGAASRIGTSDWELTGLSLPPAGQLRARAVTTNGYQNSGSGLIEQIATYSPAGNLDSLNANVNGIVYATAVQPDGKIILAGSFSSVLGVSRNRVARLNANGTLDMGFDPRVDSTVYCVAVQPDGKILLGGYFFSLQPNGAPTPTSRQHIARVNSDGTLDASFDPKPNYQVNSVAIQNDGKILLGGFFSSLQPNGAATPTTRQYIARVDADGSLDAAFDPNASYAVLSMAIQTDGKIVLGGYFYSFQPNGAPSSTIRQRVARLNTDGTLDSDFYPLPNSDVFSIALQADGKILLGGYFTSLQPNGAPSPTPRNFLARVNSDGTLDAGFDPSPTDGVYSIAVQTDGKVLFGGIFGTGVQPNGAPEVIPRHYIARVNPDGTLDNAFDPNADNRVWSIALQSDGKILLGGQFSTLQPNGAPSPTTRYAFARLQNDLASQTLSVPDSTQVLWQRNGAGPEISRATFDLSTDGGSAWSALGVASRVGVTPDWQLTGLSLPVSGRIRARGITSNGYFNGGSGLIEQTFTFLAAAEIAVYQPAGVSLTDNASTIAFAAPINYSSAKTFIVRNLGGAPLTGLEVTRNGANEAVFTLDVSSFPATLAPGASATFTVTFSPAASGPHSVTLLIASNDSDENPFEVALTGQGLTFNMDTDNDGLSDAAEFLLAELGFDWQVAQPGLVQTLFGNANNLGLYTASQIQALNADTPLISRDPITGKFKLTLALQKSVTLAPLSWSAFPFIQEGLTLTGDGKLEFEFTVPDNAAFFRLESH